LENIKIRIYKSIISPVVLYGYETWSLTLREENRLKVFETKVLRRIFGPKMVEGMGGWRRLHFSPGIIGMMKSRKMRCVGM
jgi:hypothetical protein